MSYDAYSDLDPDSLTLRDRLATDRTVLANERTLLAHIRTALGLLGGGGALVYLGDDLRLRIIGILLMVVAPPSLAYGLWRYARIRRKLKPLLAKPVVGA